jgi:hypothetical protein
MKKKYINPKVEPTAVDMLPLLAGSQVKTGGDLHDDYNEDDVTYSRHNVWTDEEEE